MNEGVHNKPVDFTKETARILLLFGYDDVTVVVQHIAGQVAPAARSLARHTARTLHTHSGRIFRKSFLRCTTRLHYKIYHRRDVEEGFPESAIPVLKSNHSCRSAVAVLFDEDGVGGRHSTLGGET